MHGTNRTQLLTPRCALCGKVVAVRVDPEDIERWRGGTFVQDAFPYLTADERELLISGTCGDCWSLLCPASPLDYS